MLVIGAGHKAEAQPIGHGIRRRQGAGAPDAARRVAAHEAIPIRPAGLQAADIEMHRIGEGPFGGRLAAPHDIAQGGIGRDLIADGDIAAAHAAGRLRIAG